MGTKNQRGPGSLPISGVNTCTNFQRTHTSTAEDFFHFVWSKKNITELLCLTMVSIYTTKLGQVFTLREVFNTVWWHLHGPMLILWFFFLLNALWWKFRVKELLLCMEIFLETWEKSPAVEAKLKFLETWEKLQAVESKFKFNFWQFCFWALMTDLLFLFCRHGYHIILVEGRKNWSACTCSYACCHKARNTFNGNMHPVFRMPTVQISVRWSKFTFHMHFAQASLELFSDWAKWFILHPREAELSSLVKSYIFGLVLALPFNQLNSNYLLQFWSKQKQAKSYIGIVSSKF